MVSPIRPGSQPTGARLDRDDIVVIAESVDDLLPWLRFARDLSIDARQSTYSEGVMLTMPIPDSGKISDRLMILLMVWELMEEGGSADVDELASLARTRARNYR